MSQYAVVTDLNRCTGCLACTVACKAANGVPVGNFWIRSMRVGPVTKEEGGQFPDVDMYFLPMQCQHCATPECVTVCPTGASVKTENGTVQIDKELCIGCGACLSACPYGVRYINEDSNVAEKCTLCSQLVEQGEPVCAGEHDIEQDELGNLLGTGFLEGVGIGESLRFEPRLAQGVERELADVGVVFYVVNHGFIVCLLQRGAPASR